MALPTIRWNPITSYDRAEYPKKGLCLHHAAMTNFDGIRGVLQNAGTSTHFGVVAGRIDQYIPDMATAWATATTEGNRYWVSIETTNSGGGPGWPISEDTISTLVEWMAWAAKKYGLGKLVWGQNVRGHRDFSATQCPGVLYARGPELCTRANALNTPAPKPKPPDATKVEIWEYHGGPAQQWVVEPVDKGSDAVMLRNVASGKYLDAEGSGTKAGTRIVTYPRHGGLNQQWRLRTAGGDVYSRPVYIESALNGTMVGDVEGSRKVSGTRVLLWTKHGGLNQQWLPVVVGLENGNPIYVFLDGNSGLALDVEGGV